MDTKINFYHKEYRDAKNTLAAINRTLRDKDLDSIKRTYSEQMRDRATRHLRLLLNKYEKTGVKPSVN